MYIWTLITLTLLAGTVSGQGAGVCNDVASELGVVFKSHETFCGLYYQCVPGRSEPIEMLCPEGTLFDDKSKVCQHPKFAKCLNHQCTGDSNIKWAHFCCDQYVTCKGDEQYIDDCPGGTVFNTQAQQCVADYPCQVNPQCRRLYNPPTSEPQVCLRNAVADNPCQFEERDAPGGNVLRVKDCALGTSFNASLCNCGTTNPACMKASAVAIDNRAIDPQCRATMVLDFSTPSPVSYTLKTPTGQRAQNSYAISAVGYTPSGNEGILAPTSFGRPYLIFWSFLQNMLMGPFGIKVSFRVDNPQEGYSFTVVGNDMSDMRPDCPGTLNIKATFQSGQWTIAFLAVGLDAVSGLTTTVQQAQSIPATNGYITTSIFMSQSTRTVSGFVSTQGSAPYSWGPIDIGGDRIAVNNCPLAVGYNLQGALNDVKFFEACGNESILISQLQ